MRLLLLASLLALSASAGAQERPDRFGIGIRLTDLVQPVSRTVTIRDVGQIRGQTIVFPLDVGPLRLEPELGFAKTTESRDDRTRTLTQIGFGAGAFYRTAGSDGVTLFGGARVRYVDADFERVLDAVEETPEFDDTTLKARRVSVAPTVGGELALGRRFGLGAEVGLAYSWFSGDGFDEFGTTALSVAPAVYGRFFF